MLLHTLSPYSQLCRYKKELSEDTMPYGDVDQVERTFGKDIRGTASNEKAIRNRLLRKLFLSKFNPEYQLCGTVLKGETNPSDEYEVPLYRSLQCTLC